MSSAAPPPDVVARPVSAAPVVLSWGACAARGGTVTRTDAPRSFDEFSRYITAVRPMMGQKDGPWYVPASFEKPTRNADTCASSSVATLDFDEGTVTDFVLGQALRGLAAVGFTTYQHTPVRPRWRVHVALSRPTKSREEHKRVVRAIHDRFGSRHPIDEKSYLWEQFWFAPAVPDEKALANRQQFTSSGVAFDVETVADAATNANDPAAGSTKLEPREAIATNEDRAVERAKEFLKTYPVAIEGHGGDQRTLHAAERCRDVGVPEHRCPEAIADWNARCVPPWDDGELQKKIANAYKYAKLPQGNASPEAMFDPLPAESKGELATVSTAAAPAATKYPPRENLDDIRVRGGNGDFIDGLCNRGELIQVIGPPGARKSAAMGWLAYCVATGADWFGHKVEKGAVLYVAAERKFEQAKRLDVMALSDGHRLRDIPINVMGPGATMADKGFAAHIASEAAAFAREKGLPVGLVVLDTLFALMPGHDTTSTEISIFTTNAAIIAGKTGAPVAVIHHTPKSDKPTGHGSQALDARYDATLLISETGDGGLIEVHKANTITERMRPIAWTGKLLKVTHKGETLQAYRPELGGSYIKSGTADEKILTALRSLIAQKMEQGATDRARCVTKKELRGACGVKKTTFNQAFKRLLKHEVAIKGDYVWTVTGNLSAAATFDDLDARPRAGAVQ